ncbi:DHH family phosphoesterase [Candidatus Woesearchaeota archaeon]|nr:DHH family phosphoesterase [Candidatus Woesearchaeota archaeon]
MKITSQKLFDKVVQTIDKISSKDKIAIFYDGDSDGICAFTLLRKILERLNKSIAIVSHEFHGNVQFTQKHLTVWREQGISHIITLDLPVDHVKENFTFLKDFKTIIIDHHPSRNKPEKKNIILFKPEFFTDMENPSFYCTTKIVYDVMSKLVDINDLTWIALTGLIADYCWKDWEAFLKEGFKKYKIAWKDNLWETDIGLLTKLISGAGAFDDKGEALNKCIQSMYNAENLKDALQKLAQFSIVNETVQNYVDHFEERAEKLNDDKLLILEVKTHYKIVSPISTAVHTSGKFPKSFILVIQTSGEFVKLSARTPEQWDANKILQECVKGFEQANGGGHARASGGKVLKKDYPEFKKRLIEILR